MSDAQTLEKLGQEKYNFVNPDDFVFRAEKGLNAEIVRQISAMKNEPEWMLDYRLKAYAHYEKRIIPTWGPDVAKLNLDDIYYYVKPTER